MIALSPSLSRLSAAFGMLRLSMKLLNRNPIGHQRRSCALSFLPPTTYLILDFFLKKNKMQGTRGSRAEGAPRRRCSRPESTPMPRRNGGECSPVADEFLSISIDISVYPGTRPRRGAVRRRRASSLRSPGSGGSDGGGFHLGRVFLFFFWAFFFSAALFALFGKERERAPSSFNKFVVM